MSRSPTARRWVDRKSTRLNSSHTVRSYAVFCLQKKQLFRRWREHDRTNFVGDHRRDRFELGQELEPRLRLARFRRLCSFANDTASTEISTLSLHDALPI